MDQGGGEIDISNFSETIIFFKFSLSLSCLGISSDVIFVNSPLGRKSLTFRIVRGK